MIRPLLASVLTGFIPLTAAARPNVLVFLTDELGYSDVGCYGSEIETPTPASTAMIQQNDGWWIGWIEEVPGVNAQEQTKETLLASLKEVLKEALEFNRQDARASARGGYTEEFVTV